MSRDITGNTARIVHNCEELDPELCSAVASLLATEPTPAEVDCAMRQLRMARAYPAFPVHRPAPTTSVHANTQRWLLVAASSVAFCMCCVASTEGWAQVARDLAEPFNEPEPLSTLAEKTPSSAQPTGDVSFPLRLVLVAHVTLLTFGLAGLAVAWLIAVCNCFLDHWRKSRARGDSSSTQQHIVIYSSLLYAAGIIFGAIWAQSTWGRPWSWDPRETFGLFTIAFAVLWMRAIDTPLQSEANRLRFTATSASIATIAFGAIVLMFVLGNRYAAALHSYGLPALTIPNLVFGLFAGCLASIWFSFAVSSGLSRIASEA
ncbi:MAG: cytochrome c biogenesis protein CcsA [Planctomycetales bacterium]|nr:cytochrome c biogenesis protein CcsA [Planctomycetales bacterium]